MTQKNTIFVSFLIHYHLLELCVTATAAVCTDPLGGMATLTFF